MEASPDPWLSHELPDSVLISELDRVERLMNRERRWTLLRADIDGRDQRVRIHDQRMALRSCAAPAAPPFLPNQPRRQQGFNQTSIRARSCRPRNRDYLTTARALAKVK